MIIMSNDLISVLALIGRHKKQIWQSYGVREMGVFGSYARQEQSGQSDLDILVDFERSIDLFDFVELKDFLSEQLNVKVDLVMKNSLKPALKEVILREVRYI